MKTKIDKIIYELREVAPTHNAPNGKRNKTATIILETIKLLEELKNLLYCEDKQ